MTEDIVARLRAMRELAGDRCDPEFNRAVGAAIHEIEKLKEMLEHMGRRLEEKDREIERLRKQVVFTEDMGR